MTTTASVRTLLIITSAMAFCWTGAVSAQPDDGRVDRLEKQVRELRSIVFQGRDTGQLVEVKPLGPDPAVTALGARLDAIDGALRQLNGQVEVLQHDVDEARHAASSAHDEAAELRGQLKDLTDRVAKLEPGGATAPPPPSTPGDGAGAPNVAAGDAAAPPPLPATAAEAYKHARALLEHNDYPAATSAFQAFIAQHGDSPLVPTAYYWLAESDSARQAYGDAVPAYANALKGWPKTPWASDATVKLARALSETNQSGQACAALSEFDRRYRATASGAVKARAAALRTKASCGG